MGRPAGTGENEHLVHVRLPGDLREGLEAIRGRIAEDDEKPSMSAMIRKAIREYIRSQGGA